MNTNPKDAWYHCGHCGSLFQSDYGLDEERLCEICHRKPGVGMWPVVNLVDSVASAKVASFQKTGDSVRVVAKTPSTRDRRYRRVLFFTLIWILILTGAVGLRYYLSKTSEKPRILSFSDLGKNLTETDKEKILNQVLAECDRTILGFLSADTIDKRIEFICRSADLKAVVEVHDKNISLNQIDVSSLERTGQKWIRLGEEWMVLTHWKDAGGEIVFDVVFRKELDGWKIDWPHFSQYSQASWSEFLAGEGKLDTAEFRLLAKKYKDPEHPLRNESHMVIVLAAPEWGNPKQTGLDSPMIQFDLMSHEGRLLTAAFDLREKNQVVSDGELETLEPEGYVRVRAKISRDELGGEFRLILNELKVCHWFDSDLSEY
jgi:hypothetical protein